MCETYPCLNFKFLLFHPLPSHYLHYAGETLAHLGTQTVAMSLILITDVSSQLILSSALESLLSILLITTL